MRLSQKLFNCLNAFSERSFCKKMARAGRVTAVSELQHQSGPALVVVEKPYMNAGILRCWTLAPTLAMLAGQQLSKAGYSHAKVVNLEVEVIASLNEKSQTDLVCWLWANVISPSTGQGKLLIGTCKNEASIVQLCDTLNARSVWLNSYFIFEEAPWKISVRDWTREGSSN